MTQSSLLDALAKLKDSRLLSSEADALLESFREDTFRLTCSFVSATRSFGGQPAPAYSDGYTVTCKVGTEETECSVLTFPSENALIESLSNGDALELDLKVLGFDSLYQRVIFGEVVATPSSVEVELAVEPEGSVEPETETEKCKDEDLEKLEALRRVLAQRVSQLQEADDAESEIKRIEEDPTEPIQAGHEPVVEREAQAEKTLSAKATPPSDLKKLDQEWEIVAFCMKGCAWLLVLGLYGFGGLLCVVGVTSLFDPSPPLFLFFLVGPLLLWLGNVMRKFVRSEFF